MVLTILLFTPLLVFATTDLDRVVAHILGYSDAIKDRYFDHYFTSTFKHFCVRPDGYYRTKTRQQYIDELNKVPVFSKIHVHTLKLLNFTKDSTTMKIYGSIGDVTVYLEGQRMNGWYQIYKQEDTVCPSSDLLTTVMIDYEKHAKSVASNLILHFYYAIRFSQQIHLWRSVPDEFIVQYFDDEESTEKQTQIIGRDELLQFPKHDKDHEKFKVTISNERWDRFGNVVFDVKSDDGYVNSTFETHRIVTTDIFFRIVLELKHNVYTEPPGMEYDKIQYADVKNPKNY